MIYQKLDYYTVICYNRTLRYCLEKIGIFDESIEMLQGDDLREVSKYNKSYKIQLADIWVEIKTESYDDILYTCANDDFLFVDCTLDYIRLEMSGSALDYLRSRGFNPDIEFHDIEFWGELGTFNVTRCDFAFDFVNYQANFISDLFEWVRFEQRDPEGYLYSPSARLRTSRKGGSSYKIWDGNTIKCFYIGSNSSNKFLRIYDKLLETTVKNKSKLPADELFPEIFIENEKEKITSWYRIELQTRDIYAMKLLYQPLQIIDEINKGKKENIFSADGDAGYYDYVLRFIFDHYMILDRDYKPIECMAKLFNWATLPKIIMKPAFRIFKHDNQFNRTFKWIFQKNLTSLLALTSVMGFENIKQYLIQELERIQNDESEKCKCQNRAFRQKASSFMVCLDMPLEKSYITYDNHNIIRFKNNDN